MQKFNSLEILGNIIVFLYKINNAAKISWNRRDIMMPKYWKVSYKSQLLFSLSTICRKMTNF